MNEYNDYNNGSLICVHTTICIQEDTMGTTQCQDKLRCFKQTLILDQWGEWTNPELFYFQGLPFDQFIMALWVVRD